MPEASMSFTSALMCAELQHKRNDTNGDTYTQAVCLALLNYAALLMFTEAPPEDVGLGLMVYDVSVTITGGVGSLPDGSAAQIPVKIIEAYQSSDPGRHIELVPLERYLQRIRSDMGKGTFYSPLGSVDYKGAKFYLSAGNYNGAVKINYVSYPKELKISGVNDVTGAAYTETVNPDWPKQISLAVIEKANELAEAMEQRSPGPAKAEEILMMLQARIAS